MSDSNPKYFLRPEAGPVPFGKLQRRAQKALRDIVGILGAAVSRASDPKRENRASRIFFVSGEPGSGKSTLYLTLKQMLNENVDTKNIDLSALKGKIHWLETLDLEVAGDEGENLLAAVLVRIIERLTDRETVSNTVHSKPCEDAIKELEELATDIGIAWEGNLQARAGKLDPDTYSEEVMRTQRARLGVNERLKNSLDAIASNRCYGCTEGTLFVLPVDDFYLKPDASLQLLRLLRMISIPRLFFLVMGDIKTIEALFVEKSLADWTAVAGDRIFAARADRLDDALSRARELRARYLRKLLPPGQRAEIEAMDWHEALVFNPEQLGEIDTLEQLLKKTELDPQRVDDNPDTPRQSPESTGPDEKETLYDFLINPAFSPDEKKSRDEKAKIDDGATTAAKRESKEVARQKAREAYSALQILDATSREIMDLWFAFYELNNPTDRNANEGEAPRLLSCVLDFVKLVFEEQDFLNEEQQGLVLGVLPTRHYTEQEIYLVMDRLNLQPEQNTFEDPTRVGINEMEKTASEEEASQGGAQLPAKDGEPSQAASVPDSASGVEPKSAAPQQGGGDNQQPGVEATPLAETPTADIAPTNQNSSDQRLWVRPHRSWKLAVKTIESGEDEGPFAKLPPRQTAWMVLLHDLTWKWDAERVIGNPVRKLINDIVDWSGKEPKSRDELKIEKGPGLKQLRLEHLVSLSENWGKAKSPAEDQAELDSVKDFRGWAVWQKGLTYKHFPTPDFETFRELDYFLFIWTTGVEWLRQLWKTKNLADARVRYAETIVKRLEKRAEEFEAAVAQQRATGKEDNQSGFSNDANNQMEAAKLIALQARTKANEAKANLTAELEKAGKAHEGVGGNEWISKYIDIWKLAGWIVINEKYEIFATRSFGWFEEQLTALKNVGDAEESTTADEENSDAKIEREKRNSDWLTKIENFKDKL